MATTNKTPNLGLPQYSGSDLFDLQEINDGYEKIDTQYKELKLIKETVESTNPSGALQGQINTINTSLESIANDLYTRKFKPKLWQSLYVRNELSDGTTSRDKELIRTDVENLANFGVEGLWLPIHIGYNETTNNLYYQTNLDTLDYVFDTLVTQYGIPVVGIKFHQDWAISNIFAMGEDVFKNRIKYMFNEIIDRYNGKFQYFGVFNEWRHFYKKDGFIYNSTTYNYVPFVIECIEMVKAKGLKCSVSIAGCSPSGWSSWNECDKSILDVSNVILMNGYPPVGNKSNYPVGDTSLYTLDDTTNAWNVYGASDVVGEIIQRYGFTKKLIITESGTPDSFRSYFAPSNTTLCNPNIPEANGEAVSLYLEGMFESKYKDNNVLEGIVWWFTLLRGLDRTKTLINEYIYGGEK